MKDEVDYESCELLWRGLNRHDAGSRKNTWGGHRKLKYFFRHLLFCVFSLLCVKNDFSWLLRLFGHVSRIQYLANSYKQEENIKDYYYYFATNALRKLVQYIFFARLGVSEKYPFCGCGFAFWFCVASVCCSTMLFIIQFCLWLLSFLFAVHKLKCFFGGKALCI